MRYRATDFGPVLDALASRLGLRSLPRDVRGELDGFTVLIGPTRPRTLLALVMARPGRDLALSLHGRRPEDQPGPLRPLDDLWATGDGELARARELCDDDVRAGLRDLASIGAVVDDGGVRAELDVLAAIDDLVAHVHALVALERAAERAAAGVSLAQRRAASAPAFRAAAAELGLTALTCPLGLRGVVGGNQVLVGSFTLARPAPVMLVTVWLHRVAPGRFTLRARGHGWWQRLRGALAAVTGRGLGSGRFALDRRFYLEHGDPAIAHRALTAVAAPAIALADRRWFSLLEDRVILAFRAEDDVTAATIVAAIGDALDLARAVGGVADPSPAAPFR